MSVKLKNEDSDQLSLLTRVQQFIGHGKSRQLEINASPSECLNSIGALKGSPPEMIKVAVETQAVKRPYQFTVHVIVHRHTELGVVVGEVTQSPMSESNSIVNIHFYHSIGRIVMIVMLISYCLVLGGASLILPLIFPHSRYPIEWFLCLGSAGSGFIGLGVWGVKKFLGAWRESLDMVSAHLLKLNVEPTKAD
jgi:hypothetical protein